MAFDYFILFYFIYFISIILLIFLDGVSVLGGKNQLWEEGMLLLSVTVVISGQC